MTTEFNWVAVKQPDEADCSYSIVDVACRDEVMAFIPRVGNPDMEHGVAELFAALPDMACLVEELATANIPNPGPAMQKFQEEAKKIMAKTKLLMKMN